MATSRATISPTRSSEPGELNIATQTGNASAANHVSRAPITSPSSGPANSSTGNQTSIGEPTPAISLSQSNLENSSQPTLHPVTAQTPSAIQLPEETNVFQLAGLITGNLSPGENVQASAARSDIAPINAGQDGDLKSGFSFLDKSEQNEDRKQKARDSDDDNGIVTSIEERHDSQA